jgi:hypothetical protein
MDAELCYLKDLLVNDEELLPMRRFPIDYHLSEILFDLKHSNMNCEVLIIKDIEPLSINKTIATTST